MGFVLTIWKMPFVSALLIFLFNDVAMRILSKFGYQTHFLVFVWLWLIVDNGIDLFNYAKMSVMIEHAISYSLTVWDVENMMD